MGVGVDRNTKN